MIPNGSIEIRRYRSDLDKAFVYSTWLRNYKHSSYHAKRIRSVAFFSGHHRLLDHLFSKPNLTALIACPKDDSETILGYLICETDARPIVHFVFVKDAFRKMGIARALFDAAQILPNQMTFTHWTYPVDEFMNKFPEMHYDPYAF